jgi:hypothetical protein
MVIRVSVGLAVVAVLVTACARVADLDVAYSPDAGARAGAGDAGAGGGSADGSAAVPGRQNVRPSAVTPVDAALPPAPILLHIGSCGSDAGLGPTGCDETAGLGCCLSPSGSTCMESNDAPTACAGDVFIACVQSNDEGTCCWRSTGSSRHAVYTAECEGGAVACIDPSGCIGGPCATVTCGPPGSTFTIGQCGDVPPPCPGDL